MWLRVTLAHSFRVNNIILKSKTIMIMTVFTIKIWCKLIGGLVKTSARTEELVFLNSLTLETTCGTWPLGCTWLSLIYLLKK